MDKETVNVLLIQDAPEEIDSTLQILDSAGLNLNLAVAGMEAVTLLLLGKMGATSVPRPNLILLDKHLRDADALEILDQLKLDDDLSSIPVAVLGSEAAEDINASFEHAADIYIAKPLDRDQVLLTMNWLEEY